MPDAKDQEEGTARREADPIIAAVLAWAVPGAGHFYIGKHLKAVLFFVLITGTFLAGLLVSGFTCVSYSQQPYWFVGQVFAGVLSLVVGWVDPARTAYEINESLEVGTLFTTVAALLNLLVVFNALNEARGRNGEEPEEEPAGASGKKKKKKGGGKK